MEIAESILLALVGELVLERPFANLLNNVALIVVATSVSSYDYIMY